MPGSGLKEHCRDISQADKWERVGFSRRAGIVVPLFSVYSAKSCGVGELADLKLLVDWAKKSGNSIIQLLPMNEVGPVCCPYDSISSFALEPLYLSLRLIPGARKENILRELEQLRIDFPAKGRVDYRIKTEKIKILKKIFAQTSKAGFDGLAAFCRENSFWLEDFALFKALKDFHEGKAWWDWPQDYRDRESQALVGFAKSHEDELKFEKWLQWQLYQQFKTAKDYAAGQGVLIKGDLPILVSRDSADVWAHAGLFKLELDAGAPPDMYCAKGQRWGTPTYNWERIFSQDGQYLKDKLRYAENFYDILRIDHVVGLFRIWSIPVNEPQENKGLHGFFDPCDEHKWSGHGRRILDFILRNTRMLLCAEDLGVIPWSCTAALKEMGIPGNEVQRWVKDWQVRHDFIAPAEYRLFSVSMLSTHDTTNWPGWWENEAGTIDEGLFARKCADRCIDIAQVKDKLFDPCLSGRGRLRWRENINCVDTLVYILGRRREEVMDFIDLYENSFHEKEKLWFHLGLEGATREKCDPLILKRVLEMNLGTNSVFCVNLLNDLVYLSGIFSQDPYQSRINTPGTVSPENWSLALPVSLEELLKNGLAAEIKKMVEGSGRC